MAETASISLLVALGRLPSGAALAALHGQLSSAQSARLSRRPAPLLDVPAALQAADVATFNFDEGHTGRFSVFETHRATVAPADVLHRDAPLRFVREAMATGDDDRGGETVVFSPGLNTPHEEEDGLAPSVPAPDRVLHYSRVLGGLRMAQLHTGSSIDQGPAELDVSRAPVLDALSCVLRAAGMQVPTPNEEGAIEVPANLIDFAQVALSHLDIEDNNLKKSMRSLLELATAEDPIVLMPYSRATIELSSALRAHKKSLLERMSKDAAERHLRDSVTVVSIGNASHGWVDGPAYIHVAAFEDALTNAMGTTSKKPAGAGADAVFLNFNQPWNNSGNEAHNFATTASQYLSVIMLANKTKSFRQLYDLARSPDTPGHSSAGGSNGTSDSGQGRESDGDSGLMSRLGSAISSYFDGSSLMGRFRSIAWSYVERILPQREGVVGGGQLVIPENVDDLTKAMIRISNAFDYLWSDAAKEGAQKIPSEQEAIRLLKDRFDSDEVDRICERFRQELK